ncbi:MAG: hypothetical protein JWM27_4026 [Gemmatimonadetes bacterium]|nr:hypothetical protein [Gemmatimonadota bacterium]
MKAAPNDGGLIAYVGLVCQIGGALLLVTLFLLLRVHARRRPYFRVWGAAWMAAAAALSSVTALYLAPGASGAGGGSFAVFFLYQFFKLLYVGLLLGGTLAFVRGVRMRRYLGPLVGVSAAYALLSAALSADLNRVVVWHAPVAAAAFTGCCLALVGLPASRATLGTRATGVFFGMLGGMWALYAVAFAGVERGVDGLPGEMMRAVAFHNSYVDLLLQMLLGYGMVVLLMEDARRETDAAHAQLAVAHDHLQRLALYDQLTGTLNRRALAEGVGTEAARGGFGAVVMLDLDNLKVANDTWGHATGDALLQRAADVLRAATRPSDRLYRWGGDEFLLVLPGARSEEVLPRLEDALSCADAELDPEERGRLRLLASLGAADYGGAEELEEAIRTADLAMYEAKALHKRACPAPDPTPAGPPLEPAS